MPIKPEHLGELLAGYEKPEDLLGEDGLFKQLKKSLLERALGAEITNHLQDRANRERGGGDRRPRDRNSTFEPEMVPKGETRLNGFDDKIISMYARGMTVREIQGSIFALLFKQE